MNSLKNVILYESLHGTPLASLYKDSGRDIDQILNIISETKADLILRAAPRYSGTLIGDNFTKLKSYISKIKQKFPNIIITGSLFVHAVDYEYVDDITEDIYTETQTYSLMAFDPAKFEITSPTKSILQHRNAWYVEIKRWMPDIASKDFQRIFLHQAQKLIEAGVDGIWIDMLFWQADWIYTQKDNNKNDKYVRQTVDATLHVCNEIKKMVTVYGNKPLLSTWVYDPNKLNNKFNFDFLTAGIREGEMINNIPDINKWNNYLNIKKKYFDNVPLLVYIDWSNSKSPLWTFSQSIIDNHERKKFEISVLKTFSDFFKKNGIIFAYPIHGGLMCTSSIYNAPRNVLSFGQYNIFDSLAPEFDLYEEIRKLMK